jgi:hypothetical protein
MIDSSAMDVPRDSGSPQPESTEPDGKKHEQTVA